MNISTKKTDAILFSSHKQHPGKRPLLIGNRTRLSYQVRHLRESHRRRTGPKSGAAIRLLYSFPRDIRTEVVSREAIYTKKRVIASRTENRFAMVRFLHIAFIKTVSFLCHKIKESKIFMAAPRRFSSARENMEVKILSVFW